MQMATVGSLLGRQHSRTQIK